MSSVHCVVVWEWQCAGGDGPRWLPHGPGVARQLEHAHAKGLTRVVLADVEPSLRGHYVNLRTLTQCTDIPEGGRAECRVRRVCYGVQSPAGRGVRWEWARLASPPHRAELLYELLPMDVQCRLEEAWACGAETLSLEEWVVQLARMTARGCSGAVRLLRRAVQLPYPLTRSLAPPPPALPAPPLVARTDGAKGTTGRRACREPQSGGATVASRCGASRAATPAAAAAAAADRKPGLKHLLHNLNIFSNKAAVTPHAVPDARERIEVASAGAGAVSGAAPVPCALVDAEPRPDTDGSSTRSGRRHSVDTVSTYLSHESKDSLPPPVGDLLDCSASSDDAFEPPTRPPPPPHPHRPPGGASIVGVDEASEQVSVWVQAVECVQWGAVCPLCLSALDSGAPDGVVALVGCQHMMHLQCLNRRLGRQRANDEPLSIECGVCGRVYGSPPPDDPAEQPPGSMAWCVQPRALPGYAAHTASILVTYQFASGVQGARHPAPGRPYYAVGFPRHSLLPDTALGRQVFAALRRAWERRRLFTISRSQTTGREHVVSWRVPPPPSERAHYGPGDAEPLLRATLRRLDRLAPPDHEARAVSPLPPPLPPLATTPRLYHDLP